MCTDTYPGAITDNDLTAGCGVLDIIKEKGATVLTDKGFGIEDLCHAKGLKTTYRDVGSLIKSLLLSHLCSTHCSSWKEGH